MNRNTRNIGQQVNDQRGLGCARSGFSLLELVIVMVIVGIMVTIAAPRIDLNRYRLNSAYQVVAMTLLNTQRQAMRKQHSMVIAFDTVNDRIRIHEDRNNNGAIDANEPTTFIALEEGVVFGRGTAPARPIGAAPVTFIRVQNSMPAVTFSRSGSGSEIGGFYLTSARAIGGANFPEDTRAFEIERSTGRTSVYRIQAGAWVRSM